MPAPLTDLGLPPLRMPPSCAMDNDTFFEFCALNNEHHFERNADGSIILIPFSGGETGTRNAALTADFGTWARSDGTAKLFDSSTGFILPNGATRAPDISWVKRERLTCLTPDQRRKFLPFCPDFVLELASPTDRIASLREKMQEYIANGARLGWLLDPDNQLAVIYRPGTPPEESTGNATLSADPVLPGFSLDLESVWRDPLA